MGVIYLVRHGKALDGIPSTDAERMEDSYDHLSDLGHRQATATGLALAHRLAPGAQPALIAGPLRRQQDTAHRIAEQVGCPDIRTDVGWKEYDSGAVVAPCLEQHPERVATLQCLEPEERDRLLGRLVGEAMQHWVHTSAYEDFRQEVRGGLARAQEQAEAAGGCAIVVTSGGPIALAVCESLGLPREHWPRLAGRILTASVTVLSFSRTAPTLLSFNEHAHLDVPDADGTRPLRRFR